MLTKTLAFILIFCSFVVALIGVAFIEFTEIDTLMILLVLVINQLFVQCWFIMDIYRNKQVPYPWVWILLTFMAPIVIFIIYTIIYVPSATVSKA